SGPAQGDADELLLGILDALADGFRHLAGFTEPGADDAVPIADDDQRAKAEAAATLHHFGDAIDLDDLLLKIQPTWIKFRHVFSLKLKSCGAGALGERLDAAMIDESAPVERHLGHTGRPGPLADQAAHGHGQARLAPGALPFRGLR